MTGHPNLLYHQRRLARTTTRSNVRRWIRLVLPFVVACKRYLEWLGHCCEPSVQHTNGIVARQVGHPLPFSEHEEGLPARPPCRAWG